MSLPDFEIFFSFPNFLRPFGNSEGNWYKEFTVLDEKYRFTCGILNFHGNALNCKDIMLLIVDKMLRLVTSAAD